MLLLIVIVLVFFYREASSKSCCFFFFSLCLALGSLLDWAPWQFWNENCMSFIYFCGMLAYLPCDFFSSCSVKTFAVILCGLILLGFMTAISETYLLSSVQLQFGTSGMTLWSTLEEKLWWNCTCSLCWLSWAFLTLLSLREMVCTTISCT